MRAMSPKSRQRSSSQVAAGLILVLATASTLSGQSDRTDQVTVVSFTARSLLLSASPAS